LPLTLPELLRTNPWLLLLLLLLLPLLLNSSACIRSSLTKLLGSPATLIGSMK
jgi:hypothetical protein